jgi:hypothetical protein
MPERIFKAEVNGKTRQVLMWLEPEDLGDPEAAMFAMFAQEKYFDLFYEGAMPADYASPLLNARVEKVRFK